MRALIFTGSQDDVILIKSTTILSEILLNISPDLIFSCIIYNCTYTHEDIHIGACLLR